MNHIKLITLNIEGDKHLARVIPFLEKEDADVVCLQETIEENIEQLKISRYPYASFAPMRVLNRPRNMAKRGLLILSKQQPSEQSITYYQGNENDLPVLTNAQAEDNRAVLYLSIQVDTNIFHIATTHFTWSVGGEVTQEQREQFERIKKMLRDKKELIFSGDFNTPRGKEIYTELATMYKDNIPSSVTTTLDPILHRKSGLEFVVDGLFTSPEYVVENIRIVEGISDHKALVGEISRK